MQDVTNARLFIPGLTNLDVVSSLPPHVCVGNFLTAPISLDCQGRWEDDTGQTDDWYIYPISVLESI